MPGRREILASIGTAVAAAFVTSRFTKAEGKGNIQQTNEGEIQEVGVWNTGLNPNYTTSFTEGNQTYVVVACWSGAVDLINTTTNQATRREFDASPLDVAYDHNRQRIVIASADGRGKLLVLDRQLSLLQTIPLTDHLDQGLSVGGAQGVTVDKDGNYWVALAYYGLEGDGAVIKVDGNTLQPQIALQHLGIENPNGIITSEGGDTIYVFSDPGFVHQFNATDGRLQRIIPSIYNGYRGAVDQKYVWTVGWLQPGKMARSSLKGRIRDEFPCAGLGNSLKIDSNGNVWVAGDRGVSVSKPDGQLLSFKPTAYSTNGLTTMGDKIFYVSYDHTLRQAEYVPAPADTHTPTPETTSTSTPTTTPTRTPSPTPSLTPGTRLFFPSVKN